MEIHVEKVYWSGAVGTFVIVYSLVIFHALTDTATTEQMSTFVMSWLLYGLVASLVAGSLWPLTLLVSVCYHAIMWVRS